MRLIHAVGIIAGLTIVISIAMAITAPKYNQNEKPAVPPGVFKNPILSLEFVASADDVNAIIAQTQGAPNSIRNAMYFDFVFIAFYLALYLCLSAMLKRHNCPWAEYLAWLAAVCAVASAGFDVVENIRILKLVTDGPINPADTHIRDVTLLKWTFGFVTLALLALNFRGLGRKAAWIGHAFTATAVAGLVALIYWPLLPLIGIPILLGLIWLSLVCLRWPRELVSNSCQ